MRPVKKNQEGLALSESSCRISRKNRKNQKALKNPAHGLRLWLLSKKNHQIRKCPSYSHSGGKMGNGES